MSFDINNPAHLASLKDEEFTDPLGIGYAAVRGETGKTLALFNTPSNNPEGQISTARMTADALLRALFTVSVGGQDQFMIQLMFEGAESMQSDLSQYRMATRNLATPIESAIDTLIVRPLNRVEVLFAALDGNGVMEYVTISSSEWQAARDS